MEDHSRINEGFELDEKCVPVTDSDVKETSLSDNQDQVVVVQVSSKVRSDADKEAVQEQEDEAHERGGWSNQLDFLFSCISVSVGLGNIWRFPYLCYKNGGGAFLIAYFISMVFCGIPIFFQEVALGQYLGVGGMTLIGQLVPIMKGVGFATMVVVLLIDIYYTIIIAWTLFYFVATFTALPDLPWAGCST